MNELQKQMDNLELEFTKMVREHRKTIYTVCYFFYVNGSKYYVRVSGDDVISIFQDCFLHNNSIF